MDKPRLPGEEYDYADETLEWFNAWRDSPITDNWTPIQWQYIFQTAIIHTTAYMSGDFRLLDQVARREEKMGLSFDPPKQEAKIVELKVTPLAKAQENRRSRAENKDRARKAV